LFIVDVAVVVVVVVVEAINGKEELFPTVAVGAVVPSDEIIDDVAIRNRLYSCCIADVC
jgi:hypothetical protein